MIVRKRLASLNLSCSINLRMVRTTTTTTNMATIMARRKGILTISNLTMTKEHRQAMEVISQVM